MTLNQTEQEKCLIGTQTQKQHIIKYNWGNKMTYNWDFKLFLQQLKMRGKIDTSKTHLTIFSTPCNKVKSRARKKCFTGHHDSMFSDIGTSKVFIDIQKIFCPKSSSDSDELSAMVQLSESVWAKEDRITFHTYVHSHFFPHFLQIWIFRVGKCLLYDWNNLVCGNSKFYSDYETDVLWCLSWSGY